MTPTACHACAETGHIQHDTARREDAATLDTARASPTVDTEIQKEDSK